MAFTSLGGGNDDGLGTLAEINVTPLVDVILVLLIIFMVTAPMLHQGIQVALPQSRTRSIDERAENPIVLSLTKDQLVYVNETPIQPAMLEKMLGPMISTRREKTVFMKADKDLPYGFVMGVMDSLSVLGVTTLGMVTEANVQGPRGASSPAPSPSAAPRGRSKRPRAENPPR